MRRQTMLLTAFLALPVGAVGLMTAWIMGFAFEKPTDLMPDAPPVGAGAGDTGGANALGQLRAGRDPDGRASIDPLAWPDGLRLVITGPDRARLAGVALDDGRTVVPRPQPEHLELLLPVIAPPAASVRWILDDGSARLWRPAPVDPRTAEPGRPVEVRVDAATILDAP